MFIRVVFAPLYFSKSALYYSTILIFEFHMLRQNGSDVPVWF